MEENDGEIEAIKAVHNLHLLVSVLHCHIWSESELWTEHTGVQINGISNDFKLYYLSYTWSMSASREGVEFKYVSSAKAPFSISCMIYIKYIYLHIRIVQNTIFFSPVLRNFAEIHWTACVGKHACWVPAWQSFLYQTTRLRNYNFSNSVFTRKKKSYAM